ncbi:Os11g0597550 [Oryza sativa Japonica Group]|uniref:Os11g0597550 protein n=1 Tax=Oryza sativa subsp. japonica TaxID=39947 RepID=A0A0P0Y4C3_ORYSJ|nr:Os11g0597550 [Oryza sativa Japonica Group]
MLPRLAAPSGSTPPEKICSDAGDEFRRDGRGRDCRRRAPTWGVDDGGRGRRRRAWRGVWMTEERPPGTSSIVVWTVEDATAADELRRGTWTMGPLVTTLWCLAPDISQVSSNTW